MQTPVLAVALAQLALTSCALAQPFWTLVGPAGFEERFDSPKDAAPDVVFGPPGYTARDPYISMLGRGGVATIAQTPHTGNPALRIRTPEPAGDAAETQFGAEAPGGVPTRLFLPSADLDTDTFEFHYDAGSFFPAPGDAARVSADFFLTNPGEFYRFSAREPNINELGGTVYFGATDALNPAFPDDPAAMRYLGAGATPLLRVCVDAYGDPIPGCAVPAGYTLGQHVSTPANAWFTIVVEDLDDVRQRVYIDFDDGAGEVLVGEIETVDITYASGRIAVGATLAHPGATLYVDNIKARGYITTRYPDANGDRVIDFTDLNLVLGAFGVPAGAGFPLGDVDNNQTVDFQDLNAVLGAFGRDLRN